LRRTLSSRGQALLLRLHVILIKHLQHVALRIILAAVVTAVLDTDVLRLLHYGFNSDIAEIGGEFDGVGQEI
jgi:hypothetical protein